MCSIWRWTVLGRRWVAQFNSTDRRMAGLHSGIIDWGRAYLCRGWQTTRVGWVRHAATSSPLGPLRGFVGQRDADL